MQEKNFFKKIFIIYRKTNLMIKLSIWICVGLIIYTLFGFFIVPYASSYLLKTRIAKSINRTIKVKKIYFNPFTFNVKIYDLNISNKLNRNKEFLSLGLINLNLEVTQLLKKYFILSEMHLNNVKINVIRYKNKKFNFSDLLKTESGKSNLKTKSKPFYFSINNIQVTNSTINFSDNITNSSHNISDINIGIPFVSNIGGQKDIYIKPHFSAYIDGRSLKLNGKTKPFTTTKDTKFNVILSNLDLKRYLDYIKIPYKINLSSGKLSSNLNINFKMDKTPSLIIKGWIQLNDLVFSKKDMDFFNTKTLRLDILDIEPLKKLFLFNLTISNLGISPINKMGNKTLDNKILALKKLFAFGVKLDLKNRDLYLKDIKLDTPNIYLKRNKNNSLNVLNFVDNLIDKKNSPNSLNKKNKLKSNKGDNYKIALNSFKIVNGFLSLKDRYPNRLVSIDLNKVFLELKNFNYPGGENFSVFIKSSLDNKGLLDIDAICSSNFNKFRVNTVINKLFLPTFDGYIGEYLNGSLTRGVFSFKGAVEVENKGKFLLRVNGDSTIGDFLFLENLSKTPFLRFHKLRLKNILFQNNPLVIKINNVVVDKFHNKLIKLKNGNTNFALLLHRKESRQGNIHKTDKNKKSNYKFNFKTIAFSKCGFLFKDMSILPNFLINVDNINGKILNIKSKINSTGKVHLSAILNNQARANIKGTLNPFSISRNADLNIQLSGVSIDIFSPYIQRYLGYKVKKGKLFYNLKLNLDKNKIKARNNIILDQFQLGEKVKSEEATRLPVKLGLAILRDRSGKITLDVPVSGDLDDPNFSYGRVVFAAIKNIFVRIAMSPFSILGAIIGTKERLDILEFDPGSTVLSEKAKDRLNKLAQVLKERPDLKIEVQGYYSKKRDIQPLRRNRFLLLLKREKFDVLSKKDRSQISSLEQIKIRDKEYLKYLKLAYKDSSFKNKPKNILGLLKKQPKKFMEEFLLKNIKISESDLKELAKNREMRVVKYLTDIDKIDPNRIFLVFEGENSQNNIPIVRFRIKY